MSFAVLISNYDFFTDNSFYCSVNISNENSFALWRQFYKLSADKTFLSFFIPQVFPDKLKQFR